MARLTCHIEKLGKGSLARLERHLGAQSHLEEGKAINPEKSVYNAAIYSVPLGDLRHNIFARIATRANPERAVRKDAVLLCQATISISPEYAEQLGEEHASRLFEAAALFLMRRYREENCMYAVAHFDEATPHLHFGFVPMTQQEKLCAKELIDRIELQRLQAELPDYLTQEGFEVKKADPEPLSPPAAPVNSAPPPAAAPGTPPAPRTGSVDLQRENHNLRLEKLLLERQIKSMIATIKSDPQLELLYMRQVEAQVQGKRSRQSVDVFAGLEE